MRRTVGVGLYPRTRDRDRAARALPRRRCGARRQGSHALPSAHPPRPRSRCGRPAPGAARSGVRAAARGCGAAPRGHRGGHPARDRVLRGPGRCRRRAGYGRGGRRGRGADLGCAAARRARHPARAGRAARARAGGRVRAGRGGAAPDHRSGGGCGHVVARAPVARGGRGRSGAARAVAPAGSPAAGPPAPVAAGGRVGAGAGRTARRLGRGDRVRCRRRRVARPVVGALAGRQVHVRGVRRSRRRSDGRGHGGGRAGARAGPAVAHHRVPPLPLVAHLRGGAHQHGRT